MIKRALLIASLIVLGCWPAPRAQAQAPDPQVIAGTAPISAELRAALESFLAANPPAAVAYYAPTYAQDVGASTLVSLAGLNISGPDDPWRIETGPNGEPVNVVWVGTVRIFSDGSGQMFSHVSMRPQGPKLAAPLSGLLAGAGGGASIRLPFQSGTAAMYGPRGIHGSGDYGTSGMYAVDLVGGDALGSNVTPPIVYASAAGTVDYVCADDTSVAVRTYDETGDNYFVYAHMVDNSALELDHEFAAGATIGNLRYGSFDDDCGWADQDAKVYHDHWMFEPASGSFTVPPCTISIASEKFHCGDQDIGTGGWILNTAGGSGDDDPTGALAPSIWDNIILGLISFVTGTANLFPEHNSASTVLRGVVNSISLFFRLIWVMIRPHLALSPVLVLTLYLIGEKTVFWTIWLIVWLIRTLRIIKQLVWPFG